MEGEQSSSAAQTRAFAVAKIKRATSLPRMKDGRRPAMHIDGVSEGERTPAEGVPGPSLSEFREDRSSDGRRVEVQTEEEPKEISETGEVAVNVEITEIPEPKEDQDIRETTTTPEPSRTKRRPRSRSRSRISKDLKGKAKGTLSPTPSPFMPGNDSSPEESPPKPPMSIPASPQLVSPIPSHFHTPRLLISPRLPEHLLLHPGTSSPIPASVTPLPSLEALQQGLIRSNSARTMAMQILTRGTDAYDRLSPSPTPPLASNNLSRSVTVSGGERSAARNKMLRRLKDRIKDEQTSGGEDSPTLPAPTGGRRGPRRGSTGAVTGPDESDYTSTGTSTPIVPPTPLPSALEQLFPRTDLLPRAASTTPSRTASAQNHIFQRETTLAKLIGETQPLDHEPPQKRRSIVVEDEDDVSESNPSLSAKLGLPLDPERSGQVMPRLPHSSDAPSADSNDTAPGIAMPIYLSTTQTSQPNPFPSSPFGTPLKEKSFRDEDEEQVLYQAENHRGRSPFHDIYDREISWVADPVETRIPIQDDYEDEDEEQHGQEQFVPLEESSNGVFSPQSYDDVSPRNSTDYKELVIETETSPVHHPSNIPPSPASAAALSKTNSFIRVSDDSDSPQTYPTRLSVASRIESDRSPLNTDFDADIRGALPETSHKRGDSSSTWEKVKSTFSRNGSNGRRSRTNSLAKRDNADSTVNRESGASLGSARAEKVDTNGTFASQQVQQPLQPSASASVLSLSPQTAPRGGVSPVPPASTADLMKYTDAKLFPFPGMMKLEVQRNRARKLSLSSSTPDILLTLNGDDAAQHSSSSGTPAQSPERQLSQQASDSHLLGKYQAPQISATPSSSSNIDYFNLSPRAPFQAAPSVASLKQLPTNREGVRKWLGARKKIFPSQVVASPSSSNSSASPPIVDSRPSNANKKPSLSDVLRRKENDLTADWEEVGSEKSRTPTSATSASGSTLLGRPLVTNGTKEQVAYGLNGKSVTQSDTEKTPKARKVVPHFNGTSPRPYIPALSPDLPSPPEHPTSTTPDPLSSLSDYPARSTSGSSSNTSSQYSQYPSYTKHRAPSQGSIVLQRLDEMLSRSNSRSPMWASAIDDPPRKLVLSSPVLQVVNSNTVKDRFLFLFNDILVIAKPIQDQDVLLDCSKPDPMARKFVTKSVVLLRDLRFSAEREETRTRSNSVSSPPRNPVLRTFVLQFAKDPDHAISSLFEKTGHRDDPIALGHLLFKTLELDRAQLGDYLSRRTSKLTLKAYVDKFGFTGLRVDEALRVFLYSINIPEKTGHTYAYSPLDALLDTFASRWYEANASIVAHDKDLAFRLVRAVVQLNDVLHGGIAQEPGPTGRSKRDVTSRDFVEAFRRYDGRGLVTDELLNEIYDSIHRERLSQARNSVLGGPPDIIITVKRPPPTRLTYRIQSEPIVLRIPQVDAQLTIQLFGQGLMFDPPVLNFAKSSEASFRVTGVALGSKTMIMSRSGPNALLYAGLPQSCSVVVERAFMRNTFNLAFSNHSGVKRRYMFSVDDPLIRHQWAVSLKRQIDDATSLAAANSASTLSKFHRAAERTAFRVLQETLIGPEYLSTSACPSSIDRALDRLTTPPRAPKDAKDQRRGGQFVSSNGIRNSHVRSKSRSRAYHKHGPGRMEDLNQNGYNSFDSFDGEENGRGESMIAQAQESRVEGRIWSSRDLELHCQQNSSIALVLSFLQVGAPDHDQGYS